MSQGVFLRCVCSVFLIHVYCFPLTEISEFSVIRLARGLSFVR